MPKKKPVSELKLYSFLDFFRIGILNTLLVRHTHLSKLHLVPKNHYLPHGGITSQIPLRKTTACSKSTTTSEARLHQTYLNATKPAVPTSFAAFAQANRNFDATTSATTSTKHHKYRCSPSVNATLKSLRT